MMRLMLAITTLGLITTVSAQDPKAPAKPKLLYGLDVKVRNVEEKNFSEKTPKAAVEFFHDPVAGAVIAISESGNITVALAPAGDARKADWIDAAIELRIRDGNTEAWKDSKKVAAELYKDLASNKLLYITNLKTMTFADVPANLSTAAGPSWHHALVLKVRGPKDADFSAAKKIGVEAYKDPTSNSLIYISDQGYLCSGVLPAKAPEPDAVKAPKGLYGFPLYARKWDEGDFPNAKMYGIEVYSDANSGAAIYVCESGSIAAVNAPDVKAPEKPTKPVWQRSFVLKARKSGESDFNKAAKYGVEVFEDKNTGATIYICETGSIAVLKK